MQVIKTLQDNNHKAVLAGGCVRDMILNREPNDYDVATSCKPDEVEKLFEKTISVGKQFGVIVVVIDGMEVEVSTFQKYQESYE